jgi:protocatechuate 4,5-dioxygenase, beta chain
MAEIVSVLGSTHHPWYHAKTSRPEPELTEDGRSLLGWSALVQESIARTRPDVLVIVASDHFHQFFANNMPQFLVGRMDAYKGTFENEAREFDLPFVDIAGDRALSTDIIESGFEHGFDFAFSDEIRLDHACVVPAMIADPALQIPVVPVLTNCGAPPFPTGQRFVDLGATLRAAIERTNVVQRVAVLYSGNLSLEVGGPHQMMTTSVDPQFDDDSMRWLTTRDYEALKAIAPARELLKHGNTTGQFLNFISMAKMTEGMQAIHEVAMQRSGSPAPCFIYE